jgi:hypothetical protein
MGPAAATAITPRLLSVLAERGFRGDHEPVSRAREAEIDDRVRSHFPRVLSRGVGLRQLRFVKTDERRLVHEGCRRHDE